MHDMPRERMMGRSPRWVERLLVLRNVLVAPFGLKTSGAGEPRSPRHDRNISRFSSETPDRLVAGFDDSHLDFRVVVDVGAVRRRPAGDSDDAGADTQLARPRLPRDHPAVSPAGRARPAAAGRRRGDAELGSGAWRTTHFPVPGFAAGGVSDHSATTRSRSIEFWRICSSENPNAKKRSTTSAGRPRVSPSPRNAATVAA